MSVSDIILDREKRFQISSIDASTHVFEESQAELAVLLNQGKLNHSLDVNVDRKINPRR